MEPRLISCSACRYHKVRCIVDEGQEHCQRCLKRGEVCARRETKRAPPRDPARKRKASLTPPPFFDSSSTRLSSHRRSVASPYSDSKFARAAVTKTEESREYLQHQQDEDSAALLSNPLKLLAQASHEVQRGDQLARLLDLDVESSSSPPSSTGERGPRAWDLSSVVTTCDIGALARWTKHFSAGLYQPMHESPSLNPVESGLVSSSRAASLYHDYMDGGLNSSVPLLDPDIHTFKHVLRHPTLATVVLYVSARHASFSGAPDLVVDLERHFLQNCLPHVVLDGCKTVEIVMALVLYASHHPFATKPSEDRAWTMLGHGIRIATELDLSSRLVSQAVADPVLKRQFRARERTWLQLWLATQSLGTATGRRQFLGTDGIVQDCAGSWHQGIEAGDPMKEADVATVARVQLHHVHGRIRSLFRYLTTTPVANSPQRCVMDQDKQDYYLSRIHKEVEQWLDQWPLLRETLLPHGTYIRVLLISMSLQGPSSSIAAMEPALVRLYESVTTYLEDFVTKGPKVGQQPNSVLVAVTYMAVLSLKLARLSCSDQPHQKQPDRLPWIQTERLRRLVRDAAKNLSHSVDVRAQRYAEYLDWLLGCDSSSSSSSSEKKTHAATSSASTTTSPNVDAASWLSTDASLKPSSTDPTTVATPNEDVGSLFDITPSSSLKWPSDVPSATAYQQASADPTLALGHDVAGATVSFSSVFGDDLFSGPFTADVDQDILAWAQRFVVS